MGANGLGCLMMTAVIDQGFQERLVAAPAEVMGDFDLTNDERDVLTSIKATSFAEFAARLYRWLERRDPLHIGPSQDDGWLEYPADGIPGDFDVVDDFSITGSGQGASDLPVWHPHPLCQELAQAVPPPTRFGKETNSPCPEAFMTSRA